MELLYRVFQVLRSDSPTRSGEDFKGTPAAINTLSRHRPKLAPEPLFASKLSSGMVHREEGKVYPLLQSEITPFQERGSLPISLSLAYFAIAIRGSSVAAPSPKGPTTGRTLDLISKKSIIG